MKFNQNEKIASEMGYTIDKNGIVYGPEKETVKLILDNSKGRGYFDFYINYNEKRLRVRVHRLQAYQKLGDAIYGEDQMVRHLNGNKVDNSYDNIDIGDNKQNQLDRPEAERKAGAKYAASFRKTFNHEKVRDYYNECKSYDKSMKEFGIKSKSTLHNILKNK